MNIDTINTRAASLGGEVLWIRLTDGVTRVRVVARPGEEEPWREVLRHFLQNYVQAEDFPKAPICLGDDSCPGCRVSAQIRASGDELNANKTKAQRRFIWVAISRDNPYDDDGSLKLKLLECPTTVFQGMARQAKEWGRDFTDAVTGFDLDILRSSGSGMPKYEVKAITTREETSMNVVLSPLTEEEITLVNEAYPNIDELTRPPEYRRFALALGFSVDETIPKQQAPQAAPGTPVDQQTQPATNPPIGQLTQSAVEQPTAIEQPTEVPPTAATAEQSGSGATAGETICPYFGTGYEADDEACRECSTASECKTQSELDADEPPKRRAVK